MGTAAVKSASPKHPCEEGFPHSTGAGVCNPEAPETPLKEAIRDAVYSRVRPIFLSTITSALGMLPVERMLHV